MNKRKNCGVGTGAANLGTIALGGLLGTTFLCGTAAPALAAADDHDMLNVSDLQRIDDGSMDDLRGGFNVGGYEISFGITVTTTVNGQQLLQTSFNVNQPGQINNVVTQYIQQQQAALANAGGAGSSSGSGGNSAGNIQVEIEIDEDGDIDIDVDSDVDDHDSPDIAQAVDQFKASMDALEDGEALPGSQAGASGSGQTQVAAATNSTTGNVSSTGSNPPGGSGAASAGDTAPQFQQASMAPLDANGQAAPTANTADAPGGTPNDQQTNVSGSQPPAAPNGSGSEGPGWTVTQMANGGGWSVSSKDLATTITQVIGDGVTTNIVNSANGIEIVHSTEMNLFLENFQEMQANAVTSQALSNLMLDMANQAAGSN